MLITKNQSILGIISLIGILIFNALLINYNAFRSFNLYDMGCFIDVGWRMLQGQKPYLDFLYSTGPVHLYMNLFFFKIFGLGKAGILWHMILTSSIIIIVTYIIARKYLPMVISSIMAMLSAASFYVPTAFPWYDHSAHLWGILVIFLIILNITIKDYKRLKLISFIAGARAVFSVMTKINIGIAYGVCFFLFWLFHYEPRKTIYSYIAGAVMTFLLFFCLMPSPEKYFEQSIIYAYQQANRLDVFKSLSSWLPKSYGMVIGIVIINIWPDFKKTSGFFRLFLLVNAVAIFSLRTGMLGPVNVLLRGIILTLAFILIFENRKISSGTNFLSLYKFSVVALVILSLVFSFRSIMYGIERGKWNYGPHRMGNYALKSSPLRGWLFDKVDGEIIDDMVVYIKSNIPFNENLLILNDYQIIYALTGRESFKGIPFIFGSDMTGPKMLRQSQEAVLKHPPVWIINVKEEGVDQMNYSALHLPASFISSYVLVKSWGSYGLFQRKS